MKVIWHWQRRLAWGSHSEKEIIISKVIFEISWKNDVLNNYETDYSVFFWGGGGSLDSEWGA